MRHFFTITNTTGCREAINLDYLISFREVKNGEETTVALQMAHPSAPGDSYQIVAVDDYTTVQQRAVQAGYV